jgi:hypothetical protein
VPPPITTGIEVEPDIPLTDVNCDILLLPDATKNSAIIFYYFV